MKKAELQTLYDSYQVQTIVSELPIITNKQYTHIYHIADVHIRLLERHDEYNAVFNKLYNEIKTNASNGTIGLMVIPGDLFHTKKYMFPETFVCAREFLCTLGSLVDTVVISGNHDLVENTTNQNSKGFLHAFDYSKLPGVFFLQDSGLYQFGNVALSVASLEGQKPFINAQSIPENAQQLHKVALWHGTINGSSNDIGYKFNEGHYRNLGDFDGYDITCLGDIHLMQFLKPNIAYPGSLVQQNFGENVDKHGYIIWDLATKTGEFKRLENDYAFITVDIANKQYTVPVYDWVKKVKLRIRCGHETSDQLLEQITTEVKSHYELVDLKVERNIYTAESVEYDEGFTQEASDVDLIKTEMTERADPRIEQIIALHDLIKSKCNLQENSMNNQKWGIKELSFSNMMWYGGDYPNRIKFDERNGITAISGKNFIGKSSIINAIIFSIFGSVHKSYNNAAILNYDAAKLVSRIVLQLGEYEYVIERTGRRKKLKGRDALQTQNKFWKIMPNGEHVDLNGVDQKETDRKIAELFGSRDDFILTNIYSNAVSRSLLWMGDAEKMKTLETIFNLDNYKILYKKASEMLKESNTEIVQLDAKIAECKNQIASFEKSVTGQVSTDEVNLDTTLEEKQNCLVDLDIKINAEHEKVNQTYQQYVPNLDSNAIEAELTAVKESIDTSVIVEDKQVVQSRLNGMLSKFHQVKLSKGDIETRLKELGDVAKPTTGTDVLNEQRAYHNLSIAQYGMKLQSLADIEQVDVNRSKTELINELKGHRDKLSGRNLNKEMLTGRLEGRQQRYNDCLERHTGLQKELNELMRTTISKEDIPDILKELDELKGTETKQVPIDLFSRIIRFLEDSYNGVEGKRLGELRNELSKVTVAKGKLEMEIEEMVNCIKIAEADAKAQVEINTLENILKSMEKSETIADQKTHQELLKKVEADIAQWFKVTEKNTLMEQLEQHNVNDSIKKDIDRDQKVLAEIEKHERVKILTEQMEKAANNLKLDSAIAVSKVILGELTVEKEGVLKEISEINDTIAKRDALKAVVTELDAARGRLEDYEGIYEAAVKENELLKLYKDLTHSKCLPLKMIKTRLQYVENDINQFLQDSVQYQFHFDCDKGKVGMYVTKKGHDMGIVQISGYEKTMLEIALKRALNKYSFVAKSTLICIDEGMQTVDDDNFIKLGELFTRLKKDYRHILIISHIDKVNNFADNSITIENNGTISKII